MNTASILIDTIELTKNNTLKYNKEFIDNLIERNSITYDFDLYEVKYLEDDDLLAYYIEYNIPHVKDFRYIDILASYNDEYKIIENLILEKAKEDNKVLYFKCKKKYMTNIYYLLQNNFRLISDYAYGKEYYLFKWEVGK